jgi:beta-N-acetylhexosaminidase
VLLNPSLSFVRILTILILAASILAPGSTPSLAQAGFAPSAIQPLSPGGLQGTTTPEADEAARLLEALTPEERIGQLFLVTFKGTDVGPETPIYDLLTTHHVGGVILRAQNDNILSDSPNPQNATATTQQVYELVQQLHKDNWDFSLVPRLNPTSGISYTPTYIPLFIGMVQEGDGYPYDQILHGMTGLPNQMALGATWNPDLAAQVGEILGKELTALGINLLLGPSLDVLDIPQFETSASLGTRAFGGDPYWVSEMGRAYVRGVHKGGNGRLATVAKRFPGNGSSDRVPEEEVATVRKSLDELDKFDLVPFYAVTGSAQTPEETTDALLTSHIRYQGLQGNIRATTRPVSFDPQALSLLLKQPLLATWRDKGGLMVSDDLGNQAVRRFYDLTSQTFDARRVALNAFLAGNDLLYIGDFSSSSDPDSYTGATRTLDFFTQKYREDTAFAQRVDESVLRILALKQRLYPSFTLQGVLSGAGSLSDLGKSNQTAFEVARQAATLLHPTQAELDDTIPDPPNQNDRIVFITDAHTGQQCSSCPTFPLESQTALQEAVLRLYGPQAGGQVTAPNLSSFSFTDLKSMLEGVEKNLPIETELERANWIVLSMLDGTSSSDSSFSILQQFLSDRPDLFLQKRLIVFAFCAPFYLDATNISKLTAYFALYSKTPQFVDAAAYLLFGELRATGASPVSIASIGYNLNQELFPDPAQIIPLEFDLPEPSTIITSTTTPEPAPPPEFRLGDVIPLRTGVILDHNGHPVPDGTPVTFVFSLGGEANSTRQTTYTTKGIARSTYAASAPGALEISAESEPAKSDLLHVDIPLPGGEVATFTPTLQPTLTPTPIPPTPTPTPPAAEISPQATVAGPGLRDWLVAIVLSGIIAFGLSRLSALIGQVRWGIRAGFLAFIGGMLAYTYLALRLPGSQPMLDASVARSVALSVLFGSALGLLLTVAWRYIAGVQRQTTGDLSPHQRGSQAEEKKHT